MIAIVRSQSKSNLKGSKIPQSERDYKKIQERVRKNLSQLEYIERYFEKILSKKAKATFLSEVAQEAANKLNLHIDRLAKRYRNALLCWYAENWAQISNVIDDIISKCLKHDDNGEKEKKMEIDPSNISLLLNYH